MTTAKALTQRMNATGRKRSQPESIFTIVSDDHNVHCMTEAMLDAWWSSQTAERKAEIFDEFWDVPEPAADLSAEPFPDPVPCDSKYAEYSRQFFAQFHGELGDALADLRNALAAQPTTQPTR